MILVDDRIGSVELIPYFSTDIPVQKAKLEFADFSFLGNNTTDKAEEPILVGIERKTIRDFINSMVTGRLSGHQVIGLLNSYNVVYIIIEGIWRANAEKLIEIYRGNTWELLKYGQRVFYAREIYNYINTLSILCNIRCLRTVNKTETVGLISAWYYWWTEKYLDEHNSHRQKHRPLIDIISKKPPLMYRIAAELPGIGSIKSRIVSKHFHNLHNMVNATENDWCRIPGIGKPTAKKLVKIIQEGED